MKFYYENMLANQNFTAKNNIVWACDITEIELNQNKKFFIFLCIDIHTNVIIGCTSSQSTIKSQAITKCLKKAIEKRFKIIPKTRVVIHTDRGTQFSSISYNNFTREFEQYVIPSMSRRNTPTDNSVAERFMRTFKEHRINGRIMEQEIQEAVIMNRGNRKFSSIINKYIKSLNKKPNRKSYNLSPEKHDKNVSVAALLMCEPPYPKAFSEHYGQDNRRTKISKYKSDNFKVSSFLEEIAAKKAFIVDKTPFDGLEGNIALESIQERLDEMQHLLENNQYIVQKSVEGIIEPVNDNVDELREQFYQEMEALNKKIDKLIPKNKKDRQIEQLRDPIDENLFPIFFTSAGDCYKRKKYLIRAQLRITYTILFYTGLRINEIRHLTQKDLENAIDAAQFSVIHHKTKQAHIHVLSKKAIKDLQDLKLEFYTVFDKHQYKYLYGKQKPMTDKNLIKMVNKDLKSTCQKFKIPFNIKSHSFRVNMITNLLRVTSVQKAANIIGHADIRSTMTYNRYALTKNEIQELLDKMDSINKK